MVTQIDLTKVRLDSALQPRAAIDMELVEDYREAMRAGAEFPPVTVYEDEDGIFWLSSGFHRVTAAREEGIATLAGELRSGTRSDARVDAARSNRDHGKRRTNEDKRRAVKMLLEECPTWSDNRVATETSVDPKTVAAVRQVHLGISQPGCTSREGADGKFYPAPKSKTKTEEPMKTEAKATFAKPTPQDHAQEVHQALPLKGTAEDTSPPDEGKSGAVVGITPDDLRRYLKGLPVEIRSLAAGKFLEVIDEITLALEDLIPDAA